MCSLKEQLLYKSLHDFFTKDKCSNMKIMLPIISGENEVSLRLLDWFVTNYTKEKMTKYSVKKNKQFIVYFDYKSQLKAYSKKLFDPFCRRNRIVFQYDDDKSICTTVGQLNFFRWAIENKVIQYIKKFLKDIEMNMNFHENKRKMTNIKQMNKHEVRIVLTFN